MKYLITILCFCFVGCGHSKTDLVAPVPDDGRAKANVNGTVVGVSHGYYTVGASATGVQVYTVTLIEDSAVACDFSKRIQKSVQITVPARLGEFDETTSRIAFFYDKPNKRTAYDVADKVNLKLISDDGKELVGEVDAVASTAQVHGTFIASKCP